MHTSRLSAAFCLAAASLILTANSASAQDQESDEAAQGRFGLDILFGWGFKDDPNPYKTGIGLRGNYYMPNGVSVGATYIYHLGHSEELSFGGQTTEVKYGMSVAGVEGGYSLPIDELSIRPYLGAGLGMFRAKIGDLSDSESKLSFWPGVDIGIPLGGLALGLDARYYVVTGIDDNPQTDADESTMANAFALYGGFSFAF